MQEPGHAKNVVVEEKSVLYFLIGYAAEAVMKRLKDVCGGETALKQLCLPLSQSIYPRRLGFLPRYLLKHVEVYCAMMMQNDFSGYVT